MIAGPHSGAGELSFLTSFQVTLMLLVWGPHLIFYYFEYSGKYVSLSSPPLFIDGFPHRRLARMGYAPFFGHGLVTAGSHSLKLIAHLLPLGQLLLRKTCHCVTP